MTSESRIREVAHLMRRNGNWFDESNEMERMGWCDDAETLLREYADIVERCRLAREHLERKNRKFSEVWGCNDSVDGLKMLDYIENGIKGS